jgi:hypothetical protein
MSALLSTSPPVYRIRCGLASWFFWMAAMVLRTALKLYRQRMIIRTDLGVALSIARTLERSALKLSFGSKGSRRSAE